MTDETTVTIFHASWCNPCSQQEEQFEEFGFEEHVDATVEHVDVETDEGQQVSADNNVRSLPTTIVFDSGSEVQRFIGVTKPDKVAATVGRVGDE